MNVPVAWVISPDADIQRVIELSLCKRGLHCIPSEPAEAPVVRPQVVVLDVNPSTGLDLDTAHTVRTRLRASP